MERLKVFVSYSSKEKSFAGDLKSMLIDYCGYEVFLAHDDMIASLDFNDGIKKAIKDCDVFIALLSENFKKSDYCDQETGIAYYLKKKIIPVKLDSTNPYGFLASAHGLKTRNFNEDGIKQVVSEVGIICLKHLVGKVHGKAKNSIIHALKNSAHFRHSNIIIPILCECPKYDTAEVGLIKAAVETNFEIQGATALYIIKRMLKDKYKIEVAY